MPEPTLYDQIILWILYGIAPFVNFYPLVYAFRPWRSTPQGRALMVKSLGNLLLIDMILAVRMFGLFPGLDAIRLIGFSAFAVGIWYLFWTLMTSPGAREYPPYTWLSRIRRSRTTRNTP